MDIFKLVHDSFIGDLKVAMQSGQGSSSGFTADLFSFMEFFLKQFSSTMMVNGGVSIFKGGE